MLSEDQVRSYNENGYILVEDAVSPEQLARLRQVTYDLIDKSREITESNDVYELDEGHSAAEARLTRIKTPHRSNPVYWEVLQDVRVAEVLRQLLGPNVLLQSAKLNIKAPGGGPAVEWHQDWAFYPCTNDSLLACGLMLDDVDLANGPLQVIPGSHKGPLLSHHNGDGVFCGAIDPSDADFHHEKAVTLTGKAGSMTVHHVRTLHGSAANRSDRMRMMLFYECLAADAWPLMGPASYFQRLPQREQWADLQERVIIGEPIVTPRIKAAPVRLPLPPAPDGGSIFKTQKTGGARSSFAT